MLEPLVGINLPESTALENLSNALTTIEEDGYDYVEICLSTFPMIIAGAIKWEVVNYVKETLKKHKIKFCAHIGTDLDLRRLDEQALQKKVLMSSIEICAALNMSPLTVHFEQASLFLQKEEAFFTAHMEAADFAQKLGVELNIENIEVEHHTKVLEMIDRASHPNLKMTLDTGHLLLSCNYFGRPFLDAVKECAPYVRHLHASDNAGTFEPLRLENFDTYRTIGMGYRFTFGRGDIHLPPLWGVTPYGEVISILEKANFRGIYLCEYYSTKFTPFNKQIQENMRGAVKNIRTK